jgi:EpsD family peptidyl-prolyl cis-trans isomerase
MSIRTLSRRPAATPLALLALACAASLVAGCGDRKQAAGQEVAARVGSDEITAAQVDFLLQQQRGLRPEQADAAGRQILDRLIDQQLALQKASELKLERDPRVAQQLEAARRDILARAYLDKVGEGAARPTADEIRKYYADKPSLFAERRIYNLQEILVEARSDQLDTLRERLAAARNAGEFAEYLKANDYRFVVSQAVRTAEQLPLQSLDTLARMQDGQAALLPAASGAQIVVLLGSRLQPVTEEQARPMIEQFLLNERRRKLLEDELRSLRGAARIERLGRFAPGGSAGTPAAPASR